MTESDQEREAAERHDAKVRRRQTLRLTFIGALAAVFTAVALDNTQDVTVGWVLDEARLPLILVLVLCLAIGVIFGAVGSRWRQRARD